MKAMVIQKKFRHISFILIVAGLLISLLPFSPIKVFYDKAKIQSSLVPLLWGIICGVMWFCVPRIHPIGSIKKLDSVLFDAIICATILLACRLIAGYFIDELGKSPYDLSIRGIRTNLILIGPELIAKELIRSLCLCTFCRKENIKTIFLITLLITISNLNMEAIFRIKDIEELVIYIAQYFGPELSKNILLSHFALYGGAGASITYAGIIAGFLQFFPVLPSLKWITEGVIGITVPILEFFTIADKYKPKPKHILVSKESIVNVAEWTVTLSVAIAFIWFIVGVFPIYPSVIATGSMKPMINEGDVILIKKTMVEDDIYNLKKGDVIQFTRDDILITHRILQVIADDNGNLSFQTKGDNNSAEDGRLVLPNEVRGTLVKVIPKAGIPTLWIKSRKQENPDAVEF